MDYDLEKTALRTNVGKSIDVLRNDLPKSFHHAPDLSIFKDNIRVSDPTGLKLEGKILYNQMWRLIRGAAGVAIHDSTIRARFFFDESRFVLKAKISAEVRVTGSPKPMYLDVMCIYEMDEKTGKVAHHRIERVDVDGNSVDPLKYFSKIESAASLEWLLNPGRGRLAHPSVAGSDVSPRIHKSTEPSHVAHSESDQLLDVYGNIVAKSREKAIREEGQLLRNSDGSIEGEKPKGWDFLEWLDSMKPQQCEEDSDCPFQKRCCNIGAANFCCGGGLGIINPEYAPAYAPIPVRVDDGFP